MLYTRDHLAECQVFKEIVAQYFIVDDLCLDFQLNVVILIQKIPVWKELIEELAGR